MFSCLQNVILKVHSKYILRASVRSSKPDNVIRFGDL